ncbi:MAG: OmpA family protein [Gammaproteobacteria bacterium]|nr:OmpA family protein [Gammaproteobacteria bacterium]
MQNTTGVATALGALALIAGCSSLPERVETLEQARELIQTLDQDPLARDVAAERYERAQQALQRAEASYEENEDLEIIEHDAYLALRNAQIAEQQIAQQRAQEELQTGEAQRNAVLLEAREQEAQQARELAQERGSELRQTEQQLARQEQQTQQARQRAQQLEQSTEQLEQELADLEAEQTDRGLILTLDDVLFEVDQAELHPGAASTMQRVAEFLNEHPERNLLIEGHTDATGAAVYNQMLSQQRAEAVRAALAERGIDAGRVQVQGLGESYPIASNDTTAGRQLNRRVEIVISDQDGRFEDGAIRTASIDEQDEASTQQ